MNPADAPLQSLALRAANHQPQTTCTRARAAPPALPCAERAPGRHRGVRLPTRARCSFAAHRNERSALRRRTPFQTRMPTAVLVRAAHVSATKSSRRLTIWGSEERRCTIWCHELVQLLSPSSAAAIGLALLFLDLQTPASTWTLSIFTPHHLPSRLAFFFAPSALPVVLSFLDTALSLARVLLPSFLLSLSGRDHSVLMIP